MRSESSILEIRRNRKRSPNVDGSKNPSALLDGRLQLRSREVQHRYLRQYLYEYSIFRRGYQRNNQGRRLRQFLNHSRVFYDYSRMYLFVFSRDQNGIIIKSCQYINRSICQIEKSRGATLISSFYLFKSGTEICCVNLRDKKCDVEIR